MDYTFSIGWFLIGIAIIIGGGLVVIFYRQIAENLANGVSSYDKVKLYGLIAVLVGFLVAADLHTFVLGLIFKLLLGR